ncbi:MAG: winged helix-turn-helix domain-containing protein, partial [Bdellovibrionaceae bacterium]|nr:winged helix-turn-helix domain-containing protein [Pseudobdellovibrionaceae bacterium]
KDLHPRHRWTRLEIASFCASTPSTVIKALAQLEEKGLISQKGREIEIRDRKALLSLHEKDQK